MSYFSALIETNGLPLLACLVVSGILVYLGMHVVERKVIFVDLALAQIAALGVMWAILMGYDHENDTFAVTMYSLGFTALGAVVFSITRSRSERVPHEALIGIIYVAASAAGLVLADRFALGTEALKELIAGRVALVTPPMLAKLAISCAVVAVVLVVLHRRFMRISTDAAAAEASGVSIKWWDFLFYLLFGVLITQTVGVLGVLPVFAYLVIPAVAAALLFETVRARLIFGWIFAAAISLIGLETARLSELDPGPTIVCLFAGALVLLGVVRFLKAGGMSRRAFMRVGGLTVLFVAFLGATYVFRKPARTDELATAIEFAKSGSSTQMRQAIQSFRKFPHDRERWSPLIIPMLTDSDPVLRDAAAALLGDARVTEAVAALAHRCASGAEPDDHVREGVIRALRAIGDPAAVPSLVESAASETEPDIAVTEILVAIDLAGSAQSADAMKAADLLARIVADEGAPRAARREATDALRAHVAIDSSVTDEAGVAEWWKAHRDALLWQAKDHRFVATP